MQGLKLLLLLALVAATKATLVDRVVPEDQMPDVQDAQDPVPTTTLLSVDEPEIQGELATLATHAHTGGQKTAIKQLTDTMTLLETPKDGGTQALMDRVKAMMDAVKPAIDAMKAGLDSDFTTAQGDLSTLIGAINNTQRTVLDTEKADILAAAQKWCTAWEAKGVAVALCTSATTNVTNFNPSISVGDALYKNIGSIECTAQVDAKCPAGVANLDEGTGQLKIGFQKARDDYYDLSTTQKNECDVKDSTTIHEATNKTAYNTEIKTTLDVHVAGCSPDRTVYDSAVSSFNTNNGHRAAMYEAFDKIIYSVMLTANTTSIAAPKSTAYYTAKFPDYTTPAPTCPTRAQYATQVSSYESLSMTESWLPADTTCATVAAAAPATSAWSSGYPAGGTMAHPSGPLEHFGYGFCSDDDKTFLMNAHKGWQSIDDHTCDLACLVEQSKQLCNEAQFTIKTCAMDGATLADSACTVGAQVGCAGLVVEAQGSSFLARLFIPGGVATIEPYTDSAGDTYSVNQHDTGGTLTGYMASNTGSSGWHWWAKGTNPTTRYNNGKCTSFGKNEAVHLKTASQVCSPECYGRSDAAPAAGSVPAVPAYSRHLAEGAHCTQGAETKVYDGPADCNVMGKCSQTAGYGEKGNPGKTVQELVDYCAIGCGTDQMKAAGIHGFIVRMHDVTNHLAGRCFCIDLRTTECSFTSRPITTASYNSYDFDGW